MLKEVSDTCHPDGEIKCVSFANRWDREHVHRVSVPAEGKTRQDALHGDAAIAMFDNANDPQRKRTKTQKSSCGVATGSQARTGQGTLGTYRAADTGENVRQWNPWTNSARVREVRRSTNSAAMENIRRPEDTLCLIPKNTPQTNARHGHLISLQTHGLSKVGGGVNSQTNRWVSCLRKDPLAPVT